GKVIVGGPHYENFPEIGRELEANGAYRRVADAREWQAYLQFFSGVDRQRIGASARRAVAEKRGSLACSLERIQRYLA
ncbi:MAG: 3-deoxy-D-manno-octulosonic acid transferase, partial [Candidatus Aminicenantes bacterium]|nr:3-deoxy-D-manno-octulosonic acid transferase [Candidatus Aminicenantes bacterium]